MVLDPDDIDRVRAAVGDAAVLMLRALEKAPIRPSSADARALRRLRHSDPLGLSDEDLATVRLLAWRYRRALPRHLAPRLPPDDPIVQEMEEADG